jgi:prepilin-type N-terminal cleavage/methylation domain-containing protein/prepilin-type processing-associated H-X9-DG protein
MTRGRRSAFTLIELLVVVAIIAIIAAILFPVFAQAREKARQTACLSNCKQLGTAIEAYLQDYDGAYPLSWFGFKAGYGWDVALFPYVKNYQAYECPSNRITPRYWPGYAPRGVGPIPGSYAVNGDMTARDGGKSTFGGAEGRTGLTEAQVVAPANAVLVTEIRDHRSSEIAFGTWKAGPSHEIFPAEKKWICYFVPFNIHQGGSTYVFCDGHAKWERVEQTWPQWLANNTELQGDMKLCDQRRTSGKDPAATWVP